MYLCLILRQKNIRTGFKNKIMSLCTYVKILRQKNRRTGF